MRTRTYCGGLDLTWSWGGLHKEDEYENWKYCEFIRLMIQTEGTVYHALRWENTRLSSTNKASGQRKRGVAQYEPKGTALKMLFVLKGKHIKDAVLSPAFLRDPS